MTNFQRQGLQAMTAMLFPAIPPWQLHIRIVNAMAGEKEKESEH
jgi:hypothetical protein